MNKLDITSLLESNKAVNERLEEAKKAYEADLAAWKAAHPLTKVLSELWEQVEEIERQFEDMEEILEGYYRGKHYQRDEEGRLIYYVYVKDMTTEGFTVIGEADHPNDGFSYTVTWEEYLKERGR